MILQLQMPLFHHKQIAVEFNCTEPVWVCCTQEGLKKIFINLFTKSTGTGLGLYLVYQQLEEVGGSIQVYSEEGQGTLFRVMLPLKKVWGNDNV